MNHTTSLEVSKSLKEAGFEQIDGYFYYMKNLTFPVPFNRINSLDTICRAYLLVELLDMLPEDMPLTKLPALIREMVIKEQPTNIESCRPLSAKALTPDNIAKLLLEIKKENK